MKIKKIQYKQHTPSIEKEQLAKAREKNRGAEVSLLEIIEKDEI